MKVRKSTIKLLGLWEETMIGMTEETLVLSDYVLHNDLTFSPERSDWLSQRELRIMGLDNKTVKYLLRKAMEDHKPPVQIINELVDEN